MANLMSDEAIKNMIKINLQVLVNLKENNLTKFLLRANFVYNNAKNASLNYILFKFNCNYYL